MTNWKKATASGSLTCSYLVLLGFGEREREREKFLVSPHMPTSSHLRGESRKTIIVIIKGKKNRERERERERINKTTRAPTPNTKKRRRLALLSRQNLLRVTEFFVRNSTIILFKFK